jgi:O-antigen ligase
MSTRGMILDRIAYTALLLVALTFGLGDIAEVTPMSTALLTVVRDLLLLAIVLALISSIARERWPAFPRALALPIAVWLTVLVLSAALAPVGQARALSTLERPASGALLAWAIYDLARGPDRWRWLITATTLGGLLVAVLGLAQASGLAAVKDWLAALHDGDLVTADVPRITSTLSHPNLAAMILELTLPLAVAWAWTTSVNWRVPAMLAAIGTFMALVLTFSRAGIVAGVFAMVVMAAAAARLGEQRRVGALALMGLALPLALVWSATADPHLDRRLTAGLDEATRAQPSRLVFWAVAADMQRDHPWFGVGPDNYRWLFTAYSGISGDNLGVHAHNQYLEAFADTGAVGLAALIWLLVQLLRTAVAGVQVAAMSSEWPWRAALFSSLCAWLLHAGFDDFERFWPSSVAFWLIAGLALRTFIHTTHRRQPTLGWRRPACAESTRSALEQPAKR